MNNTVVVVVGFFSVLVSAQAGSLEETVVPFFVERCYECHDAETAKGEVVLEGLGTDLSDELSAGVWARAMEQVAFGEMPPKKKVQPGAGERNEVVDSIETALTEAGRRPDLREKMKTPEYGNYVDHVALFDGSVTEAAWSPARLWKRSPQQFDSMLVRGMELGVGRNGRVNGHLGKVKQPFTLEERAGIADYAATTRADSATLGTMMRNAEVIVDKQLGGAMYELGERVNGPTPEEEWPKDRKGNPQRPRFPKTAEEFAEIILGDGEVGDGQIDAAVRKMYALLIERLPRDGEVVKYRSLMRDCAAEAGAAEGLRAMLVAVAVSPEAIYRTEFGEGEVDEHGRRLLGATEAARAIAYALTDEPPDEVLLEAAVGGKLSTGDDVRREVERLWDDGETEKRRVLRFFHEFFGYHKAPKVFKDEARFGKDYRNVAEALVRDADVLVEHIVGQDENVLEELLTTELYFVGHSGDNVAEAETNAMIGKFYDYFKELDWKGFPYATPKEHGDYARSIGRMFAHPNGNVVKGWMKYLTKCEENGVTPMPMQHRREFIAAYDLDEATFDFPVEQPFALAAGKRAGLLMHPAWLLAQSLNVDNDPVRRGKWVRERLLAGTVPELPITVDARIPEVREQTLRERFSVVREDAYCWRCHVRMNPLGMPFEQFDDFGRFREVEALHAKGKTAEVDASGVLAGEGLEGLEGKVGGPVELVKRLGKSQRVRQSFVRHAFRYWMGRNERLSDSRTLMDAERAYVEGGGSFRALVVSLLSSDSFLYRKVEG
ncbi:MAG: DUF1588 domain-containing protein [Verrucomicrobiales bacterium]|nr:DUF1588 domain-containing protein [Verrucomicrobiales bacterium]